MIKKILIIFICLFLSVGCSTDINSMSLEEIINTTIKEKSTLYNTNNKGYRYYLPNEFSVIKDNGYIQEFVSNDNRYYLNIDVVSYYYKNKVSEEPKSDDYKYFTFDNKSKTGYLRITKNKDTFFVELCYNYAIIEVEVEESELRYAISRSISILNSIRYNDLVIKKYIDENNLDTRETVYNIPEPTNKDESQNVLQYIEENETEE